MNSEIVQRWFEMYRSKDFSDIDQIMSPSYTRHHAFGTNIVSSKEHAEVSAGRARETNLLDFDYFDEGDKVCAIWSFENESGGGSCVQIYRVADERLVETWYSAVVDKVWQWDTAITGDTDVAANKKVFERWYEEVYAQRKPELIPEIAGPMFLRHEAEGDFEVTAEEHRERLRPYLESSTGPLEQDYVYIAGKDKVAVIGNTEVHGLGDRNWVQAWRVSDGKLVESWWAGLGEGEW